MGKRKGKVKGFVKTWHLSGVWFTPHLPLIGCRMLFFQELIRNILPGALATWRFFLLLLSRFFFFFLFKERNLIQSLVSICLNFNLIFLSWGTFFLLDQKALLAATKSKKYRPETDVYFLCQAGVEADPCFLPYLNGRGSSKEISNILPKTFFLTPNAFATSTVF